MTLVLLIVFAIPLFALAGQVIGGVVGFVVALAFHGLRGFGRHIILPVLKKVFQKRVANESNC